MPLKSFTYYKAAPNWPISKVASILADLEVGE